jgi:hypothetical protein
VNLDHSQSIKSEADKEMDDITEEEKEQHPNCQDSDGFTEYFVNDE